MSYRWKSTEVRTESLEVKLNELQTSGYEIIKVDLLHWNHPLQSGLYLILARQPINASVVPAVKYHIPLEPTY